MYLMPTESGHITQQYTPSTRVDVQRHLLEANRERYTSQHGRQRGQLPAFFHTGIVVIRHRLGRMLISAGSWLALDSAEPTSTPDLAPRR